MRALGALVLLMIGASTLSAQTAGTIVEIRVHGNHTTPELEVLRLSGLVVGEPAADATLERATHALESSGRFAGVELRRRYASIADDAAVLVVIVVDEKDAVTPDTPMPGPLRRLRVASLWMPILRFEDGYGATYGARVSFDEPLGERTRVSVPLTWGGERRAGLELERIFEGGALTRVAGGVATYRRVNPHFHVPDVRLEARVRAERRVARVLRLGVGARTAHVDFAGAEERHDALGSDVTVDTRLDPSFPRNAVHTVVGWERLMFAADAASRWYGDLRGYVGAGGSRVLALRARFSHANGPLPLSEQPLLGGGDSLRGYRAGYRAGDSMAAATAEIRVPLSSPLNIARLGVKGFVDAGAVWSPPERLRDQAFDRGIGGGFYAGVAAFLLDVDIAWPESGRPRVHVGMGVSF